VRAGHAVERGQFAAERGDLAMRAGLGPSVRQHRRVELLGAPAGGTPLEEEDRVGAARHRLQ
jgi:hypothetical protein